MMKRQNKSMDISETGSGNDSRLNSEKFIPPLQQKKSIPQVKLDTPKSDSFSKPFQPLKNQI